LEGNTMNDREIVVAALRWHTARAHRLVVGAQKRRADELDGFGVIRLQVEASRQLSQAKRIEQAALRALGKACEKQRSRLEKAEDADLVSGGRIIEIQMSEQLAKDSDESSN
jgi:hypothetical protein